MKKLTFALAVAALTSFGESIRLPTFDQVAGVSGQVYKVQSDANILNLKVDEIRGLIRGAELNSPYVGGIRITYNTGKDSYVPVGADYLDALNNASLTVRTMTNMYKFDVYDISSNAVQQVFIPCDTFEDVIVSLNLGNARHIYSSGDVLVHVKHSEMTDVAIDTRRPLHPERGDEGRYRMVGRAQFYDPQNVYGKQTSGVSFPIVKEYDSDKGEWVTTFGYYSNSVWVSKCNIYNQIPQLGSRAEVANYDKVGQCPNAYETKAFPWCEAQRVAIRVDPSMLNTNGQATPATNLFYFARVPIYVYKETIDTLVITNFDKSGNVTSFTSYPMQIHWVARPEITNEYDKAFYIPSWEKVYKREKNADNTWSTVEIGVKEANYYACYKDAPTANKDGNWRMAGNNNYTIQSYPWPYRDGSNYGVVALSRESMHTYAQKLNPYPITVSRLIDGTKKGDVLKVYPAPTGDMENRRWAGNTWHDYQAFRELAYIQFGANVQNTDDGIIGNNTTSAYESRQDDLEFYYGEQVNLLTFTIAPRTANGYSFSWLGILNFWGSEGDQMADVTGIAETSSLGVQSYWWLANLDRSRFMPNLGADASQGTTATNYAPFLDKFGYEKLSYFAAYTGRTGTYYRGKDNRREYEAFNLVMYTPNSEAEFFAVNLNSSAYDAMWLGGYPNAPESGSTYNYYMCSLSFRRDGAFGPWYVAAYCAPSLAYAGSWGGRASINLLATEGEARSGD